MAVPKRIALELRIVHRTSDSAFRTARPVLDTKRMHKCFDSRSRCASQITRLALATLRGSSAHSTDVCDLGNHGAS
eukprot:7589249-Alexandrium_andersonii.AAC.1